MRVRSAARVAGPSGIPSRLRQARHLTLPGPYLADGRLDHAYAMTVHKAQGQTSQVTLVGAAPS